MADPALAANYSAPLLAQISSEPRSVDAVKVSEFDDPEHVAAYANLARRTTLVLHGLACTARPGEPGFSSAFDRRRFRQAVRLTRTRWVSVHLESVCAGSGGFAEARFLQALAGDIALIRRTAGVPVLLENTHFYRSRTGLQDNHPATCDPVFIARALAAAGSDLLLDIAHAQVAASARGEAATEYLLGLPLNRVREIHISGPVIVAGELRDRHEEIAADGYELLGLALKASKTELVTLEYGGLGPLFETRSDPAALARQLARLREVACGRGPPPGRHDG